MDPAFQILMLKWAVQLVRKKKKQVPARKLVEWEGQCENTPGRKDLTLSSGTKKDFLENLITGLSPSVIRHVLGRQKEKRMPGK